MGTWATHIMFDERLFQLSTTLRSGFPQWTAEFIAAFGLVATILGCPRARPEAVPYTVGLFITGGYWFTASTSFASPAVTIARSLTDTFSGIRPVDAPGFIVAQLLGATAATLVFRWLLAPQDPPATD
jgi:glycerol uptake facilitator-like aquaporin